MALGKDKNINLGYTLDKWGKMIQNVKLLNGSFYILWHKDTLREFGKGKLGRVLYTQLLANFLSLPDDIRPQ
jgi:hypothetical protein